MAQFQSRILTLDFDTVSVIIFLAYMLVVVDTIHLLAFASSDVCSFS